MALPTTQLSLSMLMGVRKKQLTGIYSIAKLMPPITQVPTSGMHTHARPPATVHTIKDRRTDRILSLSMPQNGPANTPTAELAAEIMPTWVVVMPWLCR